MTNTFGFIHDSTSGLQHTLVHKFINSKITCLAYLNVVLVQNLDSRLWTGLWTLDYGLFPHQFFVKIPLLMLYLTTCLNVFTREVKGHMHVNQLLL